MKKLISVALATSILTIAANAVPISGSIDIGGLNATATIDKTLNTVAFVDAAVDPFAGNASVTNATGDFIPYLFQFVQYANFTYSPLSVTNPVWSLVSMPTVKFDLASITSINEAGPGLTLAGSGTLFAPGYDPTPGLWGFTATSTNSHFTFTSQTSSTRVPDGGITIMLLGAVLSGLGLIHRKTRG